MPNIIIHEEIAYRIAKNKNEYLNSDFFLGILAPDTPNLYGFGPKEERWLAHQRKKDLTEWKDNLIKFYNQEKNNYPKYFIEGYLTHILTDIIYDRDFYKKVRKEIINDGYEKKESHQIMGQDMLDYSSTSKIYEEVKKYLTGPVKFYDILNISQENLKLWLEKQLSTKFTVQKSKYITKKLIKNLADTVEKELFEIIN